MPRLIRTLTILFTLLGLAGCGRNPQAGAPAGGARALPVKTQTAELHPVGDFTEYVAAIKSRSASVLQPEVDGQVTKIFVHSGEHVAAGASLMQIDPSRQQAVVTNQEASVRAQQAALELARTDLQRKQRLAHEGVIARQELDQAQSAYDAAKAQLDALEAGVRQQQVQLRYYTVHAPTAGTIGDIPVRVGDRVTPQTLLTTLDTGGELEAYIDVPAEKSASVKMGMPVEISEDSGRDVRTQVSFISPRVDPGTQTLLVKAAVPQSAGLRNDQQVRARVFWAQREAPLVPVTSVTRLGGQFFVFVAEADKGQTVAHQRAIRVGDLIGNNYVVLDGLKAGDKVIVTSTQLLADGMPVSPQS
jgi:RND family efflux transporter MFP subunit